MNVSDMVICNVMPCDVMCDKMYGILLMRVFLCCLRAPLISIQYVFYNPIQASLTSASVTSATIVPPQCRSSPEVCDQWNVLLVNAIVVS